MKDTKEAKYYERLDDNITRCRLCPHNCMINENKTGICGVRKNINGKLFSLIYKKAISIHIDPIEKKPLYNFLPKTMTLSIGTIGCNLRCLHCQNYEISQVTDDSIFKHLKDFEYEDIIDLAKRKGCDSISFTYNEPTISIESILELSSLSRKAGLKNILVTNGFINKEPLKDLLENIDAVNIDLKAFDDGFYQKICKGRLAPVLDTIKVCKEKNIHMEITTLIIEGKNDSIEKIKDEIDFIADIDRSIPLHFSKAYPMYKMLDINPTSKEFLLKIKELAEKRLEYVYLGNV